MKANELTERLDRYFHNITVKITCEFDSGYAEWVRDEGVYTQYSKDIEVYTRNNKEHVEIKGVSYTNLKKILDDINDIAEGNLEDEILKIQVIIE